MAEDYQRLYNNQQEFSDEIKFAMLSLDIKQRLTERNMTLQNYDFLNITQELSEMCTTINEKFHGRQEQQLPFRLEQIDYNPEEESSAFEQNYAKLDPDQQLFVDRVISSIDNNSGKIFFLDTVAGAGKTFCENILLSRTRGKKKSYWCSYNRYGIHSIEKRMHCSVRPTPTSYNGRELYMAHNSSEPTSSKTMRSQVHTMGRSNHGPPAFNRSL
jgi:hypothetical protein